MKIDLCEIFGVEEGEEFRISHEKCRGFIYKVKDNCLKVRLEDKKDWWYADFSLNRINEIAEITKLPKRKEFTDDELCILRNIDKDFEWIARDYHNNSQKLFTEKPEKNRFKNWLTDGKYITFNAYNHLFQSIQWEDEEPVCIDDYVER